MPIRTWQIWNEANFFYFAYPVSPSRYAKLVKISSQAIKSADPGAKVILSGLFGEPTAARPQRDAGGQFLEALYRYAGDQEPLRRRSRFTPTRSTRKRSKNTSKNSTKSRSKTTTASGLYITEMGWGSQNDFNRSPSSRGSRGRSSSCATSYAYLLENRRRLDLKQVYWYSWKDIQERLQLLRLGRPLPRGAKFKPKPAWRAFVALTHGRLRP